MPFGRLILRTPPGRVNDKEGFYRSSISYRALPSWLRAQTKAMRSLEAQVREARETSRKMKAQVDTSQPTVVAAK